MSLLCIVIVLIYFAMPRKAANQVKTEMTDDDVFDDRNERTVNSTSQPTMDLHKTIQSSAGGADTSIVSRKDAEALVSALKYQIPTPIVAAFSKWKTAFKTKYVTFENHAIANGSNHGQSAGYYCGSAVMDSTRAWNNANRSIPVASTTGYKNDYFWYDMTTDIQAGATGWQRLGNKIYIAFMEAYLKICPPAEANSGTGTGTWNVCIKAQLLCIKPGLPNTTGPTNNATVFNSFVSPFSGTTFNSTRQHCPANDELVEILWEQTENIYITFQSSGAGPVSFTPIMKFALPIGKTIHYDWNNNNVTQNAIVLFLDWTSVTSQAAQNNFQGDALNDHTYFPSIWGYCRSYFMD